LKTTNQKLIHETWQIFLENQVVTAKKRDAKTWLESLLIRHKKNLKFPEFLRCLK
jgi:hypothetical protein